MRAIGTPVVRRLCRGPRPLSFSASGGPGSFSTPGAHRAGMTVTQAVPGMPRVSGLTLTQYPGRPELPLASRVALLAGLGGGALLLLSATSEEVVVTRRRHSVFVNRGTRAGGGGRGLRHMCLSVFWGCCLLVFAPPPLLRVTSVPELYSALQYGLYATCGCVVAAPADAARDGDPAW